MLMNVDFSSSFMAAEHPGLGALYVIWAIPSGWTFKLLLLLFCFFFFYYYVPDAAENTVFCVVIWFLSQDNSPPMKLMPWRVFRNSVQFSSVAQSCLTLCDPMDCSTPGFPVHHQLLEFIQTHVHWVGDAIQPSHPLSSCSPPAFNLSQHRSFQMNQFFSSGGQSIGVSVSASVLPVNIQDWSPLG